MLEKNFGKYKVKLSHTEKAYFPKSKITKGDLIKYYETIANVMIPHIKDRPVSMLRMPDGIKGEIFFQKEASDYFPNWIKRKKIKKKEGGYVNHAICNNKATLVYLANQGTVTPHVWLSRIDKLDYPDRLIFDLDPSGKDFSKVKNAAKILYKFFNDELDLKPFLMTTGSRGLHVVIPIQREYEFDSVRKFAQNSAEILSSRHQKELTDEVRKNKRKGRIFLDTARNAYAQTAVPPYSVRPIEDAPIAAPIEWKELSKKNLSPQSFNIKNIFKRLDKKGDLWNEINRNKSSIKKARKKLNEIYENEIGDVQ